MPEEAPRKPARGGRRLETKIERSRHPQSSCLLFCFGKQKKKNKEKRGAINDLAFVTPSLSPFDFRFFSIVVK